MEPSKAEQFLSELATLLEHRLDPKRREMMARMMTDLCDGVAEEAFRVLAFRCKRFPTLAEIREAFDVAQQENGPQGTPETERSQPRSPQSERLLQRSVQQHLAFDPVRYHADLYATYLDALAEHRAGKRTWAELQALRVSLIQEACSRGIPSRSGPDPGIAPEAVPSEKTRPGGLEASLPRGDRE